MSLPEFNESGDLPPGIHRATLNEVIRRFGLTGGQREACTVRLSHVYALANPNDIDVVLVMNDTFRLEACPIESRGLFDHAVAQARYGASIFWLRPTLLIGGRIGDFIAYWQIKRDGTKRGIVEVIPWVLPGSHLKY